VSVPPRDRRADPTANVIALDSSSSDRQDDLREAYDRLVQAQIAALKENVDIKTACAKEVSLLESQRVAVVAELRAHYSEQLAEKESARIDANRTVDISAVQLANERANAQATVLANNVAASADTLRNLVATTAAATASAQQQLITPLTTRISALELAQAQGQGKSAVIDPTFAELLSEVKSLRATRSEHTGSGMTTDKIIYVMIGVAGLIIAAFAYFDSRPNLIPGQVGSQTTAIPQRNQP
jgi:hypothetical protein